jgi:hypothetical protein
MSQLDADLEDGWRAQVRAGRRERRALSTKGLVFDGVKVAAKDFT